MFLTCCSPRSLERAVDLPFDLLVDFSGDPDAARLGHLLQPSRDVHPVTVDIPIVLDDDVPEVDADPQMRSALRQPDASCPGCSSAT